MALLSDDAHGLTFVTEFRMFVLSGGRFDSQYIWFLIKRTTEFKWSTLTRYRGNLHLFPDIGPFRELEEGDKFI